ncbi:elicitin-like protein [Phytophthora infestans T30-4]|uniref:Elicitin n=2 Tax=Phytophthora infestans TaxID=4787 RepID=D0N138_PHYIT|nr:elicitin-like protein [Phytophthora infestans T30-4]EEY67351.1 elicitin-like protein [Phytophthora infestans T30-4]KAF4045562.1 Elicitin [Phytophthora infestans]|eukprot:XP_002905999.1 elicitin-like protein [Phytophthora infestans T30-4]
MKSTAIVAVALVATTNADLCDVPALIGNVTSPEAVTCLGDSGFDVTMLVAPTSAELAKMCTSTACQSVLSGAEATAPTECTVGSFALYADLITPLKTACSGGSSSGSSTWTTVAFNSTDSDEAAPSCASGSSRSSSSSAKRAVMSC